MLRPIPAACSFTFADRAILHGTLHQLSVDEWLCDHTNADARASSLDHFRRMVDNYTDGDTPSAPRTAIRVRCADMATQFAVRALVLMFRK